jgi:hypothetical protein
LYTEGLQAISLWSLVRGNFSRFFFEVTRLW